MIVARYSADGRTLKFLTYLGGSGEDRCNRVALDNAGDIVIVGLTQSPDFPVPNGFDDTYGEGELPTTGFSSDGYVAKLAGDGSTVVFSTYLGGTELDGTGPGGLVGNETVRGLAIDSSNRIVVTGNTSSVDFPTTTVLGDGECGLDAVPPIDSSFVTDQFVVRLSPSGSLDFATCISGNARDTGRDVLVADDGLIYAIGHTRSTDYPFTEPMLGPGSSAFAAYDGTITALSSDGAQILRSVRIGGSNNDFLQTIKMNSAGELVVLGSSAGPDFPISADAWQPAVGHVIDQFGPFLLDAVVFVLSAQFDELISSTYIGGSGDDSGFALALDADQPVVQMMTNSSGLPTVDALQSSKAGDLDAFLAFDAQIPVSVIADSPLFFGPPTLYPFVAAGTGVNRVYVQAANSRHTLLTELSEGALDTRAVLLNDINNDGLLDVVTGNYQAPNYLYIGTAEGEFEAPVAFGDPAAPTVALGVITSNTGACIVDFGENAGNTQYDYASASSGFVGTGTAFGARVTASRDVISTEVEMIEVSAADEITVYDQCLDPPNVLPSESYTFAGRDIVDIDADGFFPNGNYLVAADRNGGGFIALGIAGQALDAQVTEFEGPPTNAVTTVDGNGFVTAHNTVYRFYLASGDDTLALINEQPAVLPAVALAAPRGIRNQVFSGAQAGVTRAAIGSVDLYIVRLLADLTNADFATYLGGPGSELESFGLDMAGPGRPVIAASTESSGFAISVDAQQPTLGGLRDGLLVHLSLDGSPSDTDGDGVSDATDNCRDVPNAAQRDTNGDGFGSACDPDLNNDNVVNVVDLGLLRSVFFSTPDNSNWEADADFNGDDVVNVIDLGTMRAFFFGAPGPGAGVR